MLTYWLTTLICTIIILNQIEDVTSEEDEEEDRCKTTNECRTKCRNFGDRKFDYKNVCEKNVCDCYKCSGKKNGKVTCDEKEFTVSV